MNPDTLLMGGHYSPHCKNYSFFMRGVDLLAPHVRGIHPLLVTFVHAGFSKGASSHSSAFWGAMDHKVGVWELAGIPRGLQAPSGGFTTQVLYSHTNFEEHYLCIIFCYFILLLPDCN